MRDRQRSLCRIRGIFSTKLCIFRVDERAMCGPINNYDSCKFLLKAMSDSLYFSADTPRGEVFSSVLQSLKELGFQTTNMDDERPWGGFYYIDEGQAAAFITKFFPGFGLADFEGFSKLSPKILLVAPGARLSWQYHHRRSEIWTVIGGGAAIMVSETDEPGEVKDLPLGSVVQLKQGERHRLIGTSQWGIVAEIWKHSDPHHPSDEEDIVRVQDDFGR